MFHRKTGAGNEIRTRDLNLGKVALYQLSYSRKLSIKLYNVKCHFYGTKQNKLKLFGSKKNCRKFQKNREANASLNVEKYLHIFQNLERETRFELATSTLARLRSTN